MSPLPNLPWGMAVQINPLTCRDRSVAGCLLVITEAMPWGANGYIQNAGAQPDAPGSRTEYSATWSEIELIGPVSWMVATEGEPA